MPTYEFRCRKCKKLFVETMTMTERGARRPKCPKCSSKSVEQALSAFSAKTSKKS